MTDLELLDRVWDCGRGSQDGEDAFNELRGRLLARETAPLWPEATMAAAVEVFGPVVHNPSSRTFKALDRRIQHAFREWRTKYGPLNPAQDVYADGVLASCIYRAQTDAKGDMKKLFPFVQTAITGAISHDRVHAGFQRRAGLVDVTHLLKAALA